MNLAVWGLETIRDGIFVARANKNLSKNLSFPRKVALAIFLMQQGSEEEEEEGEEDEEAVVN